MVRAFDDAEVIHVEGDVDPVRDMAIIQTELRLKDIEWTEKALDNLKKSGRSLGSNSLADKAKKEEIVTIVSCFNNCELNFFIQGCRREDPETSNSGWERRPEG